METSRLARTVALASFLGTASLVGGAIFESLGPEEAEAGYEVDESYFYTSLAVHGSWVHNASFGWVWYPRHRPAGWRPYTVGHWSWTDGGDWLWVSAEPFGWATYHYGRWYLDPFYGWVWIPGSVWAPAWVSWRDCDDYIGWAPLGPWGYWDSYYGRYRGWHRYDRWHDYDGYYGGHHGGHDDDHDWDRDDNRVRDEGSRSPGRGRGDDGDSWNFTRKRDFAGTRVDRNLVSADKTPGLFGRSRPLPPPSEEDERAGRGITRAFDRQAIERASGRTIRPVRLEDDKAPPGRGGGASGGGNEPGSDRVRVFRPNVKDKPGVKTPDQLGIAKAPSRVGRSDDGRGERGAIDRSGEERGGRSPQADRGRDVETGGRERPARDDERGGYERPAREDERGGYVRPGGAGESKDRKPVRTPSHGVGDGNRDGAERTPQVERRTLDAQPKGHPVERFERPSRENSAEGRAHRSPYEAPTADQRRVEQPAPASRGPQGGSHGPAPAIDRSGNGGGNNGRSPSRESYTEGNGGGSPSGDRSVSSGGDARGGYNGGGSYGGDRGGYSGGYPGGGDRGGYSGGSPGGADRGGYSGGGSSPGGGMHGGGSGGGGMHGGGGGGGGRR